MKLPLILIQHYYPTCPEDGYSFKIRGVFKSESDAESARDKYLDNFSKRYRNDLYRDFEIMEVESLD